MRIILGIIILTFLGGCLGRTNTQVVICPTELPQLNKRQFPSERPANVKDLQIAFLEGEAAYLDLKAENSAIKETWGQCNE